MFIAIFLSFSLSGMLGNQLVVANCIDHNKHPFLKYAVVVDVPVDVRHAECCDASGTFSIPGSAKFEIV